MRVIKHQGIVFHSLGIAVSHVNLAPRKTDASVFTIIDIRSLAESLAIVGLHRVKVIKILIKKSGQNCKNEIIVVILQVF